MVDLVIIVYFFLDDLAIFRLTRTSEFAGASFDLGRFDFDCLQKGLKAKAGFVVPGQGCTSHAGSCNRLGPHF